VPSGERIRSYDMDSYGISLSLINAALPHSKPRNRIPITDITTKVSLSQISLQNFEYLILFRR
jgi:hypothetical protein